MALTIVCSNCGWRKRIKRRSEGELRYCPRCTCVTHVRPDEQSWGWYVLLATVGVILIAAVLGCLFLCVLSRVLWVMRA